MSLDLANLITLFEYLKPDQWRSMDQVAAKLSVGRRTAFRYLAEIKEAFDPIPSIESGSEGYRLCKNEFIEFLESREDYAGVAALVSSPLGSMAKTGKNPPEQLAKTVRELVETRGSIPESLARSLFASMRSGNYLDLSYQAKTTVKAHRCVPIKFFMSSGIPYVVSYDEGYGHCICLAADKISEATKSKSFMDASLLLELREYVNGAWGMMVRHKERSRTEVSFDANQAVAVYFAQAPLHSSQKSSESKDKTQFTLTVHNESEFARYLLRFGRAVRLRSPQSAIDEMKGFLSHMGEFYDGKAALEP